MEYISSLQSGLDEHKPSLFELLSEQQLAGLLPPSVRYLLVLATHRHPRYLLRILNSFDELWALTMLVVERHYLLTYGGGFTENFYGLKRERVLRIRGGEAPRAQRAAPALMRETLKLSKADVWRNLAVMVGLPYIKRKLDESYEIHAPSALLLGPQYHRNELAEDATFRQRILHYYKWFLRRVYPSINAAYYFSTLAFSLAYLFDNTKYSSPFLWLIGTRIRRLGEADHRAIALAAEPTVTLSRPGAAPVSTSIFSPHIFLTTILPRLLSSLKILLPTSIFALKFLEWWHASDFANQLSRKAAEGVELPPPIVSGLPVPTPKQQQQQPHSSTVTKTPSHRSSNSVALGTSSSNSRPSSPSATKHTPHSPPRSPPRPALKSSSSHHSLRPSKPTRPISSSTSMPIYTVPPPTASTTMLCPICLHPITTPTACQTGYVYCYACIFKWIEGTHERQTTFMAGEGAVEGWGDDDENDNNNADDRDDDKDEETRKSGSTVKSREGAWESGAGRCAVTGRRVLGGTDGLRRVMV